MEVICIVGLLVILGSITVVGVTATMLSSQISRIIDDGEDWV